MASNENDPLMDSARLLSSLFALLPIPVAIVDENDRLMLANSCFNEAFPNWNATGNARLHEIVVPGMGTFDVEVMPLNDQGLRVFYGVDVSREVCLRRQLTTAEQRVGERFRPRPGNMPTCLNQLVESIAFEREMHARAASIGVSLELDPQLPRVACGAEQIEMVLTSLMMNAEHSIVLANRRCGAIVVKTWLEGERVRLSISDNGCGLSRHLGAVTDTDSEGIETHFRGIDLCAGIVKDHGGEMFCWSRYDTGATYTIELPIAPSDAGVSDSILGHRWLSGRSILVVAEHMHVTELIVDALRFNGALVHTVESDEAAEPLLHMSNYDLIILDQALPELCQSRFERLIEYGSPGAFQRFLFLTAGPVRSFVRPATVSATVEFIRRPFHMKDVMSTIAVLLSRRPSRDS